jgi:hypothetical protein
MERGSYRLAQPKITFVNAVPSLLVGVGDLSPGFCLERESRPINGDRNQTGETINIFSRGIHPLNSRSSAALPSWERSLSIRGH